MKKNLPTTARLSAEDPDYKCVWIKPVIVCLRAIMTLLAIPIIMTLLIVFHIVPLTLVSKIENALAAKSQVQMVQDQEVRVIAYQGSVPSEWRVATSEEVLHLLVHGLKVEAPTTFITTVVEVVKTPTPWSQPVVFSGHIHTKTVALKEGEKILGRIYIPAVDHVESDSVPECADFQGCQQVLLRPTQTAGLLAKK